MIGNLRRRLAERMSARGHRWHFQPPLTGPAMAPGSKTPLVGEKGSYEVPSRAGGRYCVVWDEDGRKVNYLPPPPVSGAERR